MKGLTLLELVIVLFFMTLSVFLTAQTFGNSLDQKRYERTLESMGEIKKAILGTHSKRVRGDIRFAGYVEDMGDLPELIDGQPRGLWTRDVKDTPGNEDDDLIPYRSYTKGGIGDIGRLTIYLGWRGPYLKPPAGGILKDGWGNPFVFERHGNDFIIKSLGADGQEGGAGYDQDIVLTIKGNDWLGTVAGSISPYSIFKSFDEIQKARKLFFRKPDRTKPTKVIVRLFYKPKRCKEGECQGYKRGDLENYLGDFRAVDFIEMKTDPNDGYFHFEDIPIGTERLLLVAQPISRSVVSQKIDTFITQPYNLEVEPGINWLGNLGVIP